MEMLISDKVPGKTVLGSSSDTLLPAQSPTFTEAMFPWSLAGGTNKKTPPELDFARFSFAV